MSFRVGLGQDSHRFEKISKPLVLGGVIIPKHIGLKADSDGDVIIHSLCNALSTAIGRGSLDTWAGPMAKKGITDSKEFLKVILGRVRNNGFKINNVAIMLEGKRPGLEEYRPKMQASLAKLLRVKKEDVGIAFTTGQGLTVFGKGKGIQVFSTVLLSK